MENTLRQAKSPEKYAVDHRQFIDVNTSEVAYILGLMWGDGYIDRRKRGNSHTNTATIALVEDDFRGLIPIFNKIGKWRYYQSLPKKGRMKMIARVSNRLLCEYLEDNDYVIKSNTSPTKIIDKIPHELQRYFFLGLFDADGCYSGRFVLASGMNQEWTFMVKLFNELKITNYYIQKNTNKRGHSSSHFQLKRKRELKKLFDYLYPNDFEFGFKRKFEKLRSLIF